MSEAIGTREFAEKYGVTQATVSKWCTNTSQPSLEMLMRIAEALEVDMKDLLWPLKQQ